MYKAGLFQKVSFERFYEDLLVAGSEIARGEAEEAYRAIKLPERPGRGAAFYSLFSPIRFALPQGSIKKIPTGINAILKDDWFAACISLHENGLRVVGGLQAVGSGRRFEEDEGHIILSVYTALSDNTPLILPAGSPICRTVLLPYGVTFDDVPSQWEAENVFA